MSDDVTGWLTTQEVMEQLGIGRTRLWQLVRDGQLTAYRWEVNRTPRYYARSEVERRAACTVPASHSRESVDEE